MRETWVRSLGREDPLAKGMATHSSVLDWRIPWTEEPRGLQSMESQRVRHKWATFTFLEATSSSSLSPFSLFSGTKTYTTDQNATSPRKPFTILPGRMNKNTGSFTPFSYTFSSISPAAPTSFCPGLYAIPCLYIPQASTWGRLKNRAWDLFLSEPYRTAGSAWASAHLRVSSWQNASIHSSSIMEQPTLRWVHGRDRKVQASSCS